MDKQTNQYMQDALGKVHDALSASETAPEARAVSQTQAIVYGLLAVANELGAINKTLCSIRATVHQWERE